MLSCEMDLGFTSVIVVVLVFCTIFHIIRFASSGYSK